MPVLVLGVAVRQQRGGRAGAEQALGCAQVFEREFDYTVTISENDEQPVNGAMHFVPKGKYREVRPLLGHTPWRAAHVLRPAGSSAV